MNPFTRFLNQWSPNRSFDQFITHWDVLEKVLVQVYRKKMMLLEAEPAFDESWSWLRKNYQRWEGELRPYWQKTQTAGQPTQTDPFQLLIDLPNPAAIPDNWMAMQHLASAREALNQYVLSK